jgi:hypothetical protein
MKTKGNDTKAVIKFRVTRSCWEHIRHTFVWKRLRTGCWETNLERTWQESDKNCTLMIFIICALRVTLLRWWNQGWKCMTGNAYTSSVKCGYCQKRKFCTWVPWSCYRDEWPQPDKTRDADVMQRDQAQATSWLPYLTSSYLATRESRYRGKMNRSFFFLRSSHFVCHFFIALW